MATIDGPRGSGRLTVQPLTPKPAPNAHAPVDLGLPSATDKATIAAKAQDAAARQNFDLANYDGQVDPNQFNALFGLDLDAPCKEPAGGGVGHALDKAGDSKVSEGAGNLVPGLGVVPDVNLLGQSVHDFSHSAHMMLHDPESTIKLAHHLQKVMLAEEEGAEKAVKDFFSGTIGKARAFFGGAAPAEETAVAAKPLPAAGEQLTLPGMEPEEPTTMAPTGAGEAAATSEAAATETAAEPVGEGKQLTLPGMEEPGEEPFGNLTKLGKFAGGAAGIVSALALPSQVDEGIVGWNHLLHGDVSEESLMAASKGTAGTAAAVGGLAEGAGVALKTAGLAEGALPALEAVGKLAGPAGGVVAGIQGGFDVYDGIRKGNTEQAVEGGAELVGGGLMVASVAFPPLAIAGGAVLLGTAIYKDRKNIAAGARLIGEGQEKATLDVAHGFVSAGKDTVKSVKKAGSDLVHGHVLSAAGDLAKGAGHAAADVAKGAVKGLEDAGSGLVHGVGKIFSGW